MDDVACDTSPPLRGKVLQGPRLQSLEAGPLCVMGMISITGRKLLDILGPSILTCMILDPSIESWIQQSNKEGRTIK